MEINKKAVFFSTDALIALFIILLTISVAYPVIKYARYDSGLQGDVLMIFSELKISEINNSHVQTLIDDGKITNQGNTLLEQIAEFYVTNLTEAKLLAEEILDELTINENVGIWYGTTLIASVNTTSIETAKNIQTERQIVSGVNISGISGESVTGFSSRAFLSSSFHTKYFYFGGYVGDGNISVIINYTGTINSSEMELAIPKDFDVYVNGNYSGSESASTSEIIPKKYNLSIANFNSGENLIELRGDNLYVAGGYIKILYENSVEFSETERYSFPGIEGAVNLYDSFYVPDNLTEMDLNLHINNNYSFFINLGNTTIYNGSTDGEQTISIDNSQLSSLLDYDEIEGKTLPLRLGFENVSYVSQIGGNADVFSVTDLSGSMAPCVGGNWICCWFSDCTTASGCSTCGGILVDDKIQEAKLANYVFIDSVLNLSGNRAGLVGYESNVADSDYHLLSNDNVSLKSKVDDWDAGGGTCICCGINKAADSLITDSSADKYQSMIVMSDGAANVRCDAEQGTGSASGDAIQAACDAYENHGIIVYAVGFGDEDEIDETTLQAIAICGNGDYSYGDVSELAAIYQQITEDILDAAYNEQTIEISGDIYTRLYPDSYIEFDYNKSELPYGLVMTSEKQFSDEYFGSFKIPTGAQIVDANVISYSGAKWTDYVEINNTEFYNLSRYGEDYIRFGDPYSVNIPNSLIQSNNVVRVTTGLAPDNSSAGSQHNKVIYRVLQNVSAYSGIQALAGGCTWTVDFDGGSSSILTIPTTYSGANVCSYQSGGNIVYDENDALQYAVYKLFLQLDFELDGDLDVKITEQNLEISSNEITGIPFTWSTEVQVRKWS